MIIDKEDYDYLEHFGVKGMRWGVRNQANRDLNRASREKDREKRKAIIDKARANVNSGKVNKDWKKAKAQYKIDKQTMGSREARKKLAKARDKLWDTNEIAAQARDGKEVAVTLLAAGVGTVAMAALMSRSR